MSIQGIAVVTDSIEAHLRNVIEISANLISGIYTSKRIGPFLHALPF